MARLPIASSTLLAAALVRSTVGLAGELPPAEAPSYAGVYQHTAKHRETSIGDWETVTTDSITIAVADDRSRWDHKSDGRSVLVEGKEPSTTVFGGTTPPNVALRSKPPFTPIGWEFGYKTVRDASPGKPEVLGTTTIAGTECTRLKFDSEDYGTPEYCVAKSGIVLRFENRSPTAEGLYEAVSIDTAPPAKDRFSVPAGYEVQQRSGPRRNIQIF